MGLSLDAVEGGERVLHTSTGTHPLGVARPEPSGT